MPVENDPGRHLCTRTNASRPQAFITPNLICHSQNLRKNPSIFRCPKWKHTDVLCAGFLRQFSGETMVGPIQIAAMARHISLVYQRSNSWKRKYNSFHLALANSKQIVSTTWRYLSAAHQPRAPIAGSRICINHVICLCTFFFSNAQTTEWNRSADETKHYEVFRVGVRHHVDANIATCQATLSIVAAFGGRRSHVGKWEENLWDHGWQEPDVQVLDATGLGHKYH